MKTTTKFSVQEIGKELPFSVPENYFEQFASNISKQISETNTTKRKLFKSWMYMAAAIFIGIIVLTPIFYSSNKQTLAVINSVNYESYVLSQVDETAVLDCYVYE